MQALKILVIRIRFVGPCKEREGERERETERERQRERERTEMMILNQMFQLCSAEKMRK